MTTRILLIWTSLFLLRLDAAQSQTPTPTSRADGLDVVMLVDQSGSMWGHPVYHPAPNDRVEHRIGAVQGIVLRLAEHVEGSTFVHRVSVIDFGDQAQVALSNYELRYDPANPGAAVRNAEATVASRIRNQPLVNTNTPEAMRLALQEYDTMAAGTAHPGRRRVMLILTDGAPNVPHIGNRDLMKQLARQQAQALQQKEVEIYVIGLNDADNYWLRGDGDFWTSIAGQSPSGLIRARLAGAASKNFATILQGIVDEWLGVTSNLITGDLYDCPPYLRRIVFNVTFGSPRSPVRILDPDGNVVPTAVGGGIPQPGTFLRFIVDDPKPGLYTIDKDPSSSYTAYVEEHSARVQRLTPVSDIGLNVASPVVFQATNAQGAPLQELSDWPITATVDLTAPSGARQELDATFIGEGKFEISLTPTEPGSYRARLKGIITFNTKDYDIFAANALSYDEEIRVSNLQPYTLRFENVNPVSGLRVWPLSSSAALAFELVDPQGNAVADVASVVNDPETWLSLEVIDEAGATLEGPVALAYHPGLFEASVPVDLDWTSGEGWWTSDQLSIRVVAEPDRFTGDRVLHSLALPEAAQHKRIGSDPLTAGPLPIRYSWLVLVSLVLIALVLVGVLGWLLFKRLGIKLFIMWADSSRGRYVEIRVYDADADPSGYTAKKFPVSNGSQFKFDRLLKVTQEDKEVFASTLRVKRAPSLGEVSVEVRYGWNDDPKKIYTLQLRSGWPKRLKGLDSGGYVISLETKRA